jgi:uronate dehydrogenase
MSQMPEISELSVAITGGSGRVGTALRKVLSARLRHVRIVDIVAPAELAANESFALTDLTRLDEAVTALAGMDGVIHLAGIPNERALTEMVQANVIGTSHVYEAAKLARVPRVVLGSSNHATGFYPRDVVVGPEAPMRPDSIYGLTKCWGELVAGMYFDKHGIRSLIIRIGNAQDMPRAPRSLEVWISPSDLAQLCTIGLTHPDVDVTTVFGVSAGGGSWWDNSAAARLGYVPRDVIRDFAHPDAFKPVPADASPVGEHFQGATFCTYDHDGVIRRR